ncbi:MAG: SDR family NAD(P)-dependent oxidoreductase [Myxococcota bacterium]
MAIHLKSRYGPWAVVTGASDGIGRETALKLGASGINLVLVARRTPRLEALALKVEQAHGVRTRVLSLDLSRSESVQQLLDETKDLPVGLLIAAAGYGGSGRLVDAEVHRELEMVDVNCRAVLQLTHGFAQRFMRQKRGGIVLFSSIVAFQGVPRAANYAATKAYVQSLAEGLRPELAPHGVDILVSAPGPVRSGFGDRANMRMNNAMSPSRVAVGTLSGLGRRGVVRPGFLSKFLEFGLSMLPRSLRVRVLQAVMHGMTRHQVAREPTTSPSSMS